MAAIGLALLAGCQQQYYRITDVQTGKEFYTRSIEGGVFPTRSGTAGFTDLTTGDRVYLHSFRVTKIAPEEVPATQPSK
jgi:hypothetical protein